MAEERRVAQSWFSRVRSWIGGLLSRIIRRGFFRIVFALFLLLVVAPLVIINIAANRDTSNWILDSAISQVFDNQLCDVSWDRGRTEIRGPGVVFAGSVTYHDFTVKRRTPLTHSSGKKLEYEFVRVPKFVVNYDFKRLPRMPVTSVELPERVQLYFNIDGGRWMDADLFKAAPEGGESPQLPQIIVREAMVRLRADGVLASPEDVASLRRGGEPKLWYEVHLAELAMLPNRLNPDNLDLSGTARAAPFGTWQMGGSIVRDTGGTDVLFAQRGLKLDRAFVSALGAEVRSVYDQFQIQGRADLSCRLSIERSKPLQFTSEISIYEGSMCYVGFPAVVSPAMGKLRSVNNNVYIEEIRGMRGSAEVIVDGSVTDIGVVGRETVSVNVRIADLLVDENFRLALLEERLQPENANPETGEPYTVEEWKPEIHRVVPGYPEWPGARNAPVYPNLPDILPFVCRGFTPAGLCNFDLSTVQVYKGMLDEKERRVDKDMHWRVFARDAAACFTGPPEWKDGGFPVPLYRCYGVVEGILKTGSAGKFIVRGYTDPELANVPDAERQAMLARPGLVGERGVAGGQLVFVRATYTQSLEGRPPELVLNVTTDGLVFDDEIENLLPADVRAAVEDFTPRGRVDVERATVTVRPGMDHTDYDFDIKAKDVVAKYQLEGAQAPVEMSQISGNFRVERRSRAVRLTNVTGQVNGSPIAINLSFRREREAPEIEFEVKSSDFNLTHNLRQMLTPTLAALFDTFQPQGQLALKVTGSRGFPGKTDITEADVSVNAASILYERFPYPMKNIAGRVFVTVREDSVEVALRRITATGSEKDTQIGLTGHTLVALDPPNGGSRIEGNTTRFDFAITATHVRPDATLVAALTPILSQTETGTPAGEKPAALKFMENLRIDGTVGLNGRLTCNARGEIDWNFEVLLEGCGINFTGFPYPIKDLSGSLIIEGKKVSLRNCRGKAEGGDVLISEANYDEETGWMLTLSAVNMPFSRPLRDALPETLRRQFDRLQPKGTYDIQIELAGKDNAIYYVVSHDLKQTDLDLGLHFDDVTARVDAEGSVIGDRSSVNAEIYIQEAFFKKARFNDITSRAQMFDERLSLPNLRGKFYGGTVEASFTLVKETYNGAIVVRGADVKELGKTAFPEAGDLAGALDAEVKFYSNADKDGQIGRGRIDVGNKADGAKARLASVPLFSTIFDTTGNKQEFDEGHVFFWLGQDRITIREMDFVSDAARVETFGPSEENYVMYGTTEMRLKLFFTLAPRAPLAFPVLQQVFDLLKQILFPLYVTGSLNAPKVEAFSLGADELERQRDVFPKPPRES
ncbi:MAG: hypothetical protein IT462_05310 [Planctomycetes bacterium]|nr:hypothetical protein [Planctomycetota bacterium]